MATRQGPTAEVRLGSAIFNADHGHLAAAVTALDGGGIDFFHWDVFDGHFIPDLGFPPQTLRAVRDLTDKPFEVHLAALDPLRLVPALAKSGANLIHLPAESVPLLHEGVCTIRDLGLQVGISLAVGTPLQTIREVLPFVDSVLVLGRVYGESGSRGGYLPQAVHKIAALRQLVHELGLSPDIQAAGSLTVETGRAALAAGARSLSFGGTLHKAVDLVARVHELRQLLTA